MKCWLPQLVKRRQYVVEYSKAKTETLCCVLGSIFYMYGAPISNSTNQCCSRVTIIRGHGRVRVTTLACLIANHTSYRSYSCALTVCCLVSLLTDAKFRAVIAYQVPPPKY